MAEGVCLRVVLQPNSDVESEKYALVSVALQVVSRSRRCSRSIPRRRDLGMVMVILLLLHWTSTPGAKIEGKSRSFCNCDGSEKGPLLQSDISFRWLQTHLQKLLCESKAEAIDLRHLLRKQDYGISVLWGYGILSWLLLKHHGQSSR